METGSAARRRGFTLIEMMVVVAIIMILAGMVLYGVQIAIDSARKGDTRALCLQVRDAITMYYTDNKVYPFDNNLALSVGGAKGLWVHQLQRLGKRPPYIQGLDDTRLTLSTNTGSIFDHYSCELEFRVVGDISIPPNPITCYYRNSNTLKTFYVWSLGKNQVDQFTAAYTAALWNTPSTSYATFSKIQDPEIWASDQPIDDFDDIIVSN